MKGREGYVRVSRGKGLEGEGMLEGMRGLGVVVDVGGGREDGERDALGLEIDPF